MRIAKTDYFTGAFLTSILKSVTTVPVICDAKGLTKCLSFSTESGGKFYAYIKYSTSPSRKDHKGDMDKWYIQFTPNEFVYLTSDFMLVNGAKKIVVIVRASDTLTDTHICVLTLDEALSCLKSTNGRDARTINVERIWSKHCYSCYGYDGIVRATPPFDHLKLFATKARKKTALRMV